MTVPTTVNTLARDGAEIDTEPVLAEWLLLLWRRLGLLLACAVLAGAAGFGASYLVPPTFVSSTSFLPPQQASNGAGALAALGSLAGLAGGGQTRNTADQYVALMQSATVSDRMIDQFKLMAAYDVDLRVDARMELAKNVRIAAGKKDGLVVVEVEDSDPQRAARMANQYIEELRRMTSTIAVTEAQQRRVFFERQLQATKDKLIEAQLALQSSGFNQASLQAEPKAAAEAYAKLRAEATSAEVRLQTLRSALTDSAPEVQAQQSLVGALRAKVASLEQATAKPNDPGYVARYREFKYQETLFELLARQYETARVDEGREGALLQVVDVASPAERKFKPKRSLFAGGGLVAGLVMSGLWVLLRAGRPQPA
jgi:uncharacterized protein involved in exopolysaccharide biosynthesis